MNTEGYTLREVDVRLGRPKGSAFRAFKRRRGALRENVDFTLLPAHTARAEIERLRAAGRIYRFEHQRGRSDRIRVRAGAGRA